MKVLYVKDFMHNKNQIALNNYKNIQFTLCNLRDFSNHNLSDYDIVYSPSTPLDVSKYPSTNFVFGPHFSTFPNDSQINTIKGPKTIYIQPSQWALDAWKIYSICNDIKMLPLPFGVETNKFKNIKPLSERENKVLLYFKHRHPSDLTSIENFLKSKNINYRLFKYGSYNEMEYIEYLQNCKFAFWLDAHESQGFALEEVLSCDVPMLVWNVITMDQEHGSNYGKIPANTIPYWDKRCGEFFYDLSELEEKFDLFISTLSSYKPRDYILENLSMEVCEKKFMDILNHF